MLRILYNGRSAMMAQQEKLDSISNNLANVNTEGYKRVDVSFKDLVYETLKRDGYPTTGNNAEPLNGTGVKASGWLRDDGQGSLQETGLNTDMAIDGEGYFRVTLADGSKAYTRSGSFTIDSSGTLVDKNGNRLDVEYSGEKVSLDKGNFGIDKAGTITLNENGKLTKVGKINLYNFVGQDSMASVGESLYVPKAGAQGYTVTDSNINQGYVEASNVDIAREMTDMIVTQRAFELGSRGLKTADEMWGIANNLRSR